ncbi:sugar kinase [uncultured Pontibacter sp.]|uniref:sugar kinase n=1 Tax=uncultured Pontibacter sp. TaxID=453356 RepID=UPI002606AC64|nr:sugar kinase [uncultured Pontibacter sp.]
MAHKVVTFGEVMMRLSTPGFARFIQSDAFDVTYGGGEANVAVSLAQFGVGAAHVTRFPDNELGRSASNLMRKYGVDTQHIVYGGNRLGLYFLETGASVRASKVIYDRAGSAFADLDVDMIDWERALEGANWFHWTGITPAISEGAAASCKRAIEVANSMGITVSADINYRKNLWQYGKKASEVMPDLIAGCDIIVSGKSDAKDILNIKSKESEDEASYIDVFSQIMERFPKVKKVINTTRGSISASHNTLSGMLYNGKQLLTTTTYDINPIIDRIGGGDAFMAGFIYGMLQFDDDQRAIDFGVAASVLKHTILEDANLATVAEVEMLLNGDTSGRLQR